VFGIPNLEDVSGVLKQQIMEAIVMRQVVANMTGTVLQILVTKGDSITEGQDVVLLESMKMEVPVPSEYSGTVTNVLVDIGSFVNEGDVLLELE
jgi:acetyl-CoA carboxylase biotin carboxyl carrier protein